MGRVRSHLLAGAALSVAMALAGAQNAAAQQIIRVESGVPVPDTAVLPPPTAQDVAPPMTTGTTPAASETPKAAEPVRAEPPRTEPPKPERVNAEPPVPVQPAVAAEPTLPDKLREMTAGRFDRIIGGKKDRAGVESFYADRNFAPLWLVDGDWSPRAKAAMQHLSRVDADGMDPADYAAPQLKSGSGIDALAEAELRFTQTVLTFARHAQTGRVHWSRIAHDILYEQVKPEPADVLAKLAGASNVSEALDSYQPPHAAYKALKAKLAEARRTTGDAGPPRIPSGIVLRYAKDKKGVEVLMNDPRVPQLRTRLGLSGDETNTTYDRELSGAVAKFQKEHGLAPTGQLTAATIDAMNGSKRDRDADIIMVNMERWRWLPRDLGNNHVLVNIPEFRLRLYRDRQLYWTTKVVVGKPNMPTPITTAEMKFITVNPTWNVPPSIIQNEYLPALAQDPNAMARIGLRVETNRDGTVRIWQPPGEKNALGRIRFNFPNKFLVYQHDTPDKYYFAHEKRAYSHGCMRVENPAKYAEMLLSIARPNDHYSEERIKKMFGGGEVNIDFPAYIPVHLTYQTAYVDDAGKLQIREDVYGRDSRMLALLKSPERRMADVPVASARGSNAKPVRAPAGMGGYGGGSFFERLFGGGSAQPVPPQRIRQRAARSGSPYPGDYAQ